MSKYDYNPITHDMDMTGDGDVVKNYGVAWNDEMPLPPQGVVHRADVTFVTDTTEQLATKTAASGDTAIVKTTGKLHTYGTAWDGGANGEYGIIYIAENEQYVWDTTKFVLISTENAKTLNGKGEGYFAKESEAAKRNGSYPLMTVGSAKNLTGGSRVAREFAEDTAGGSADIADGIVQINKIKGNTIVWNQLYDYINKPISSYVKYGTVTVNNIDGIINVTTNGGSNDGIRIGNLNVDSSHKYYCNVFAKNTVDNSVRFYLPYFYTTSFFNNSKSGTLNTKWQRLSIITNASEGDKNIAFGIRLNQQQPYDNFTFLLKNFVIIDLTKMFGAGNEPTTVEEFEKMFPLDYYDYNDGEIISLNPTGIKTVGFNAYNHATGKAYVIGGRQYQITGSYTSIAEGDTAITPDSDGKFTPAKNGELTVTGGDSTTTCVHLVWSGKRDGEYEEHWEETRDVPVAHINTDGTVTESAEGKTRLFPDGLCSAGSVYDELTPTKAIKRIGKVNLGSLNWVYQPGNPNWGEIVGFYSGNIIPHYTNSSDKNIICKEFLIRSHLQLFTKFENNAIASRYNGIEVCTLDYTNATIFKTAMTGIYFYYELATPVEVTLAEPLNLNYRVSDFGTERLLPINGGEPVTTPIRMDVEYGLNVVDTVRNLSRNHLGMTGTHSTFTAIASALAAYGITMTLGNYDETNKYYPVTISGGWKPANAAPASATAAGNKGEYYIDADYFYVCVDTATWKRFALSTW